MDIQPLEDDFLNAKKPSSAHKQMKVHLPFRATGWHSGCTFIRLSPCSFASPLFNGFAMIQRFDFLLHLLTIELYKRAEIFGIGLKIYIYFFCSEALKEQMISGFFGGVAYSAFSLRKTVVLIVSQTSKPTKECLLS